MDRRSFLTAITATPFLAGLVPQVALASPSAAVMIDVSAQPLSLNFLSAVSKSKGSMLMHKRMRNILSATSREANGPQNFITWDKDAFGARVMSLGDTPILITDYGVAHERVMDFVGEPGEERAEILVLSPEATAIVKGWEQDYRVRLETGFTNAGPIGLTPDGQSSIRREAWAGEYDCGGVPNTAGVALLKKRPDVVVLTNVPKKPVVA